MMGTANADAGVMGARRQRASPSLNAIRDVLVSVCRVLQSSSHGFSASIYLTRRRWHERGALAGKPAFQKFCKLKSSGCNAYWRSARKRDGMHAAPLIYRLSPKIDRPGNYSIREPPHARDTPAAVGSTMTFTTAGLPLANARSSAGRISSGSVTSSPCAPSSRAMPS